MPVRAAGSRVGPYELLSLVGTGGMGEVWKARDTRLDRVVAVKFSQAQFSDRFEQEARAVAALNHPNIAQIYDVGDDYIVMEFIEGSPVRPPGNARQILDIAVQIADGLSAAHAAGFVHRDLKPDNILLTKDGRIKILDFGIAKQNAAAGGDSARTITSTGPGAITGTVAYMSPEQVRGEEVDLRSDQFSFGLILYELAAGKRAFQSDSAAETMAAIIRDEPEPLPATLPAPLCWTIERCLAKDKTQRYDSTSDLYRELRQTRDGLSRALAPAPTPPPGANRARRRLLAAAVLAVFVVAALLAGAWFQRTRPSAPPAWAGVRLGGPVVALSPRISPDGEMLALIVLVNGQTQLAIMEPDGGSWTVLTREATNGSVCNISWARDGSRLFFDRFWERPAGIYSIPPLGGDPTLLLQDGWAPQALPDGSLVVLKRTPGGRHDQAHRFWPETGRTEPLPVYVDRFDVSPPIRAFADGKEIVYVGAPDEAGVESAAAPYVFNLVTRQSRRLEPKAQIDRLRFQLGMPLAPTPDDRAVLMLGRQRDAFELIRVERDGKPGHTPELSFADAEPPWYVDAGPDGSIYVDAIHSSESLSRFSVSGKLVAESASPPPYMSLVLPLHDGRLLFTGPLAGKLRLLAGTMDGDFRPFLQASMGGEAEYAAPAGDDEVVLLLGSAGNRRIGFASTGNGALKREIAIPGGSATAVAVTPDLQTLYYSARGSIYSLPVAGGSPSQIAAGEDLAMAPSGRFLAIKSAQGLARIPLPAGPAEPIAIPAGMRLAVVGLSPASIDRDGRILFNVVVPDGWHYKAAIADRTVALIPVDRPGEDLVPGWMPGGDIVAAHDHLGSSIWRFRQTRQ